MIWNHKISIKKKMSDALEDFELEPNAKPMSFLLGESEERLLDKNKSIENFIENQRRIIPPLFHIFSIFYLHYVVFSVAISILILCFVKQFTEFAPAIGIIVDFSLEWLFFGAIWLFFIFFKLKKVRKWGSNDYPKAKSTRKFLIRTFFIYVAIKRFLLIGYYSIFYFCIKKEEKWDLIYHYCFCENVLLITTFILSGILCAFFNLILFGKIPYFKELLKEFVKKIKKN